MTPRWAAFLGLTAVLLLFVLGLARLSQGALVPATTDGAPDGQPGSESLRLHQDSVRESGDSALPAPRPDRAGPRTQATPSTGALLANVALTQGLVAALVLAGAWYFEIPARALGAAPVPAETGLPALLLGTVFGVLLWSANEVGAAAADAYGVSYDERVRELLAPDSLPGWLVLLGAVLPVIAVAEELLFRGALVGTTHAGFGVSPWALAALSAVAFALGHGAQGRAGIVVTGVLGFVLAAGFVVTGSLLVVIVAHYVVNALEFLVHEGLGLQVGPALVA